MCAIPTDNGSNLVVAFQEWVDVHQDAEKDEVQADTNSDGENNQSPPTSVDESDIEDEWRW